MNFSFDITAKASQNLTRQRLPGNAVHKVTFVKCEAVDIPGVKHPGEVYKVLRFRLKMKMVILNTLFLNRRREMTKEKV